MITLFDAKSKPLSQEYYDFVTSELNILSLTCPGCRRKGCLIKNGHYRKKLHTEAGVWRLSVQRLRCECGKTHSLFLSSMVGGSTFLVDIHQEIAQNKADKECIARLQIKLPDFSEHTARAILRQFRRHWEQRLLSFSIPLSPLKALQDGIFAYFERQFMQIKCWPNIKFYIPT